MEKLLLLIKEIIELEQLNKKNRVRRVIHRRFYLMSVLRSHDVKLKKIGSMFNQDHSTVIHGLKRYDELKKMKDTLLAEDTKDLVDLINGNFREPEHSIIFDVRNAVTKYDWNLVRARVENGSYIELKQYQNLK
jgi:hypothetical protein